MDPQTAAVLGLKGSLHFRLLLLKIPNTAKETEAARVRKSPAFLTEQMGQHRAAVMRHYPAKIPR
jgi:hypothetical protein